LRDETRLLEQAQRARAAGRADEALRILSAYAARFPGGVLRSESLVMQVLCLCELGRHADAQALAEKLVRLHPESPLVPRLSRSCVRLPAG
jgi:outer membrane protein assembly factor BamD (BamD/ComL family)